MKTSVLNKLLQEKGWEVIQKHKGYNLLSHSIKNNAACFVIPTTNSEKIPTGTLNALLRTAYKSGTGSHWTTVLRHTKVFEVVMEKQGKSIWGRIETPNILAAARGTSVEQVINTLQAILTSCASDETTCYRSVINAIDFVPVYDTTAVWDLFRQLKANHIAGHTGIDLESINRFMTGSTFPSVEQAERLEASIHELGRQLMQLSIR
ncbi:MULTISPECIES: hypothetical protein [Spirosoma]|uniref:Uncharacterized protein n=1 Tax=Spirosoma liriopis TaxID=2937440 RepID=A0ABT0HLQ3_9BACT|nr:MULTISPECIES: hypothetical protein [Spirosoma]MCK8493093.1 hypothetical protein [Spirosoma liriopis]UHG92492.1 hypothetical protein LQ777_06190 [Spirosoma oryzicola]